MYFVIFYVGACFGSFFNVVIDRVPREISFINDRSYCPKCKTKLGFFDLFPIFSFILLRGKCRYCKSLISYRCILVELITGLAFFLSFYKYGFTSCAFVQLVFWSMLLIIGLIDFDTMYIYDNILIFYFVVLSTLLFLFSNTEIKYHVYGGVSCFLFFLLIYLLAKKIYGREAFGFGDVLFVGILGLYLGIENFFLVCFMPFYIAMIDIFLRRIFFGRFSLKMEVPFGPFMCISAWLISIYSKPLIDFFGGIICI